jgi:hypothetical protein
MTWNTVHNENFGVMSLNLMVLKLNAYLSKNVAVDSFRLRTAGGGEGEEEGGDDDNDDDDDDDGGGGDEDCVGADNLDAKADANADADDGGLCDSSRCVYAHEYVCVCTVRVCTQVNVYFRKKKEANCMMDAQENERALGIYADYLRSTSSTHGSAGQTSFHGARHVLPDGRLEISQEATEERMTYDK